MSTTTWIPIVSLGCVVLLAGGPGAGMLKAARAAQAAPVSAFAKNNLHAWAFEEYDAIQRTPAERARLLTSLGFTRAGYVGRNVERMKEFDAYVTAYREQQIQLIAVWTPVNTAAPLEEPHIRSFLDGVDRHRIRPQWWVTLEQWDRVPEDQRLAGAVATLRPLQAEASRRGLELAIYGHGRDAWFTQPEHLIAIAEQFRSPGQGQPVGIVYNFHHAHSHLDRFAEVFPKLLPHLVAVNLNGMKADGPMILPIGEGDREQDMIGIIHRAGYRGPVGLLHHQRTLDAAVGFRKNMSGLRGILAAVGDAAGAATY